MLHIDAKRLESFDRIDVLTLEVRDDRLRGDVDLGQVRTGESLKEFLEDFWRPLVQQAVASVVEDRVHVVAIFTCALGLIGVANGRR